MHPGKLAISETPRTIPRIVKDPVGRFIDVLVKGGDNLIQQSLQSSQLNLLFVLKENIKGRTVPNTDLSNLMEILANDQS